MKTRVEKQIGSGLFWIETGEWAKQAHGSCVIGYDDNVVLCATTTAPSKPGQDFFPLTCDYRERVAAAGKFPGGFLKREGRPSLKEVLTSRLIDRPIRPLFPKGFYNDVQVYANVLASDKQVDPDVIAMNGSATCLMLSPLPFMGPLASARIGYIDGEFVPFPTIDILENSELDLVVSGNMESILMIEGFARELPEPKMFEAIMTAHKYVREICELQLEIVDLVKPEKMSFEPLNTQPMYDALMGKYYDEFRAAKKTLGKVARAQACDAVKEKAKVELVVETAEESSEPNLFGRLLRSCIQRFCRTRRSRYYPVARAPRRTRRQEVHRSNALSTFFLASTVRRSFSAAKRRRSSPLRSELRKTNSVEGLCDEYSSLHARLQPPAVLRRRMQLPRRRTPRIWARQLG